MKAYRQTTFAWIAVLSCCWACQPEKGIDWEAARAQILHLHDQQRIYHFEKDSIAFANQLSENFISVNRGIISQPTHEETRARYNRYFSTVEFVKWDDNAEPIIRFSDDGSLAYTIVDKTVLITYPDTAGHDIRDTTHFAWTTIYKKYGDEWKVDCVTSTEKSK